MDYTENFECVVKAENVDYKLQAVIEAHPANAGWSVGAPRIDNMGNGMVKLSIPLTKTQVIDKDYHENFTATVREEEVQGKIDAVIESHPGSLGWSVGNPVLTNLGDGTVKITIPLTKSKQNTNVNGRRMH